MTDKELECERINRLKLKAIEAESFPDDWVVRTDRPTGLVAYDEGLVRFEKTNLIIRVRRTFNTFPEHIAPLSILFTHGGQEDYEIDGRRLLLDDRSYLIHNFGQKVSSTFHSPTPMESFTLAFWPGFAEEAYRGMVTPDDHLLDVPRPDKCKPLVFFDQLYPHDVLISPLLNRIRAAVDEGNVTKGWLEEQYYQLLKRMLLAHRNIGRQIEQLPAMRAATRVELYRRLHRARDFMESYLDQPLSIGQIAQAAWCSPYHFLRQFKEVFGVTPHQYLTRRRLDLAQHLLRTTELPVTDICFQVGFESLGSFSTLFRQHVGLSPQDFRNRMRLRPGTTISYLAGRQRKEIIHSGMKPPAALETQRHREEGEPLQEARRGERSEASVLTSMAPRRGPDREAKRSGANEGSDPEETHDEDHPSISTDQETVKSAH